LARTTSFVSLEGFAGICSEFDTKNDTKVSITFELMLLDDFETVKFIVSKGGKSITYKKEEAST